MVKSVGRFSGFVVEGRVHFTECHTLTAYMDCLKNNQLFYNILIWIRYTNVHEAYIIKLTVLKSEMNYSGDDL